MARGRKALSLDEQLEKITTEIENMESSLKEMKKQRKNWKTRSNRQDYLSWTILFLKRD